MSGAVVAIILGVLFFIFLPHDVGDVTTDAFFVGVGALLFRSTYLESRKPVKAIEKKNPSGKNMQQSAKKKRKR
jgi:hypothetical protein